MMAVASLVNRPHVDAGMERRTALMAAAAEGSVDVLAQLLENGAQMSEIDDLGMCALSFSAAHGHTDAAKALCARGANVNATDKRGRTPLMHAFSPPPLLGGHGVQLPVASAPRARFHARALPCTVGAVADGRRAHPIPLSPPHA